MWLESRKGNRKGNTSNPKQGKKHAPGKIDGDEK